MEVHRGEELRKDMLRKESGSGGGRAAEPYRSKGVGDRTKIAKAFQLALEEKDKHPIVEGSAGGRAAEGKGDQPDLDDLVDQRGAGREAWSQRQRDKNYYKRQAQKDKRSSAENEQVVRHKQEKLYAQYLRLAHAFNLPVPGDYYESSMGMWDPPERGAQFSSAHVYELRGPSLNGQEL